jgi:hypothetical protein
MVLFTTLREDYSRSIVCCILHAMRLADVDVECLRSRGSGKARCSLTHADDPSRISRGFGRPPALPRQIDGDKPKLNGPID